MASKRENGRRKRKGGFMGLVIGELDEMERGVVSITMRPLEFVSRIYLLCFKSIFKWKGPLIGRFQKGKRKGGRCKRGEERGKKD